jgi:iron(III) transport system ATP-binding protein
MTVHARTESRSMAAKWGPRGTAAATFAARLSFEHVSLSYGSLEAVHDVSFELLPGEIVCLLGPSGCGKTSLLRVAAGIERPTSGRLLLDGEEIAGPKRFAPPEKRNIGLMFQDYALFPHLTILENVAFGLKSLGRDVAEKEARLALKRVGLAEYEQSYPYALSGGEQQRVALARAIVPRPAVMLMDEPFSGLDQRLRDLVRQETLALLKETRASSMLVTHDPVEAMGMADRILLMRNGRLVQSGSPHDLYTRPADPEAARFFSDFNEFTDRVTGGRVRIGDAEIDASGFEDGKELIVMIRPQGIRPARQDDADSIVGQVLEVRFLGDFSELWIQFQGIDLPVLSRAAISGPVKAGEVRPFTIDRDHVVLFASDTA